MVQSSTSSSFLKEYISAFYSCTPPKYVQPSVNWGRSVSLRNPTSERLMSLPTSTHSPVTTLYSQNSWTTVTWLIYDLVLSKTSRKERGSNVACPYPDGTRVGMSYRWPQLNRPLVIDTGLHQGGRRLPIHFLRHPGDSGATHTAPTQPWHGHDACHHAWWHLLPSGTWGVSFTHADWAQGAPGCPAGYGHSGAGRHNAFSLISRR